MGQKVHPYGFRLGVIRQPRSRWFAEGEQYRRQLVEDIKVREHILDTHRNAGISDVIIERSADTITVTIETAKPGIIIGRGGRDVDQLRQQVEAMVEGRVRVNVEETPQPDLCAQLVAENIAREIERRISPRRAMQQAIERAMGQGAQGMRCTISGRIRGAEIARSESMGPEGRVPLQTLRADIGYGLAEAHTGYGHIGVKVWIYNGEILPPQKGEKLAPELVEEEAQILEGFSSAAMAQHAVAPTPVAVVAEDEVAEPMEAAPTPEAEPEESSEAVADEDAVSTQSEPVTVALEADLATDADSGDEQEEDTDVDAETTETS